MNIKNDDINSVLTLCNSLQLATVCLSLDMYITKVNHVASVLFMHPEHQLINKLFHDICRELGVDAPIISTTTPNTLKQISIPTTHWLSSQKLVNVHWNISCCLGEEDYTGYLLVGKIIVNCVGNQPLVQMENILRSLPCSIYSKNMAGDYMTANKYQLEMAGLSNEKDMITKSDYDTPWFGEAAFLRKADVLTLSENTSIVLEEFLTLINGKKNIFLSTKSPFKDEHGNLLGIIGTSVNITQQRSTLFPVAPTGSLIQENKDSSQIYLSKKEIECVNWMIKGKSSSEIATILSISSRTVEAHMNNIKKKLNCYKQFQVGYLVGKYGYLLL